MKKTTIGKHTKESLESMAALFEHHAASLRVAATILPPGGEVQVPNESSRVRAKESAAAWVSAATQAAFDARVQSDQNGVRKADTAGPKRAKTS